MITTITTTTFRMLLILPSMGMKELISQRMTPAAMSTNKTVKSGIFMFFKVCNKGSSAGFGKCYITFTINYIIHTFADHRFIKEMRCGMICVKRRHYRKVDLIALEASTGTVPPNSW